MAVTRNVALFNIIAQAVLFAGVLAGAYLGRTRKFGRHCLVMRALMGGQILLMATIMAPQLVRYLRDWGGFSAFTGALLAHHVLGLLTLALWIYINLALAGLVKAPGRYPWLMWSALVSWAASLVVGGYLFWYLWR